jgi:hypothetical protein
MTSPSFPEGTTGTLKNELGSFPAREELPPPTCFRPLTAAAPPPGELP